MGLRLSITSVLLLLNFLAMLRLEGWLSKGFTPQLFMVVVGILLSLIFLLGVSLERKWAWPLGTILFAASMGNIVWLYVSLGGTLTAILALFVNLFGLMLSITDYDLEQEASSTPAASNLPLETYTVEPEVDYEKNSRKGRKSK